ncbi:MAG: hypothetical protein U0Y10_04530 [Spirosomataceae bacterium]
MNEATLIYLAEKLIEDIRASACFSDELLSDMNRFPLVDYLREKVRDSDIEVILSLIKSQELSKCYLGLNLVNKVQHRVRDELISFWHNTNDYERKYFLMWPLLNNAKLTEDMHKEIYSFLLANWERWKQDYVDFAGGLKNLLNFSQQRFYSQNFPNSKKWVYLASLKVLENRTDILVALNKFKIDENDPMQQTVLQFLIK